MTFLEKILNYYNLSNEDYLNLTRSLSLADIRNPYDFKGMKEAKEIVLDALKNNEKIMVYGDYDTDGINSTSIIVKTFLYLDKVVGYYVPSRYIDGYGLNLSRAKEIVNKKYNLVILVDNGVCALDAIKYLKDNNVKVIVIDHHENGETLPIADVIIHPQLSNFSDIKTSAGFCCFMFSIALLERIDPYLLILGAISIISDMMPLIDFNRDLVRIATDLYKNYNFYNIDLLKEDNVFDYSSIGLKISPKVNAIGRIIKTTAINHLITFFISNDNKEVYRLYKWIEEVNNARKEMTNKFDLDISFEEENEEGIVKVYDIDEGINGIIANRIIQKYEMPTIVLTKDSNDENILKGSMRAKGPFNVVDCLNELGEYLLTFGGHALAGGLSLKVDQFDNFKNAFLSYCKNKPTHKVSKRDKAIEISINELTMENYEILSTFKPFGQGFVEPLFLLENIKTKALSFLYNKPHIISKISIQSSIVGFNIDKNDFLLETYRNLYGKLSLNRYKDSVTLQFIIDYYTNSDK